MNEKTNHYKLKQLKKNPYIYNFINDKSHIFSEF